MPKTPGLFIVFEGPEGSGKTSQANLLVQRLNGIGQSSRMMREPGGTRVGEGIRKILLDRDSEGMQPLAELFLFQASRVQFIHEVVRPSLESGEIFVADRFALSSMAYQIYARNLPEQQCLEVINLAVQGYEPDVYFILLLDPEIGRQRQEAQGKMPDRFESEILEFHHKVLEGYTYFGQRLSNCVFIDTNQRSVEEVHREVINYLRLNFRNRFPNL